MGFPVQPYDFLMLAVLVASTLFGLWKGMAWQLAALASLVVSAGVAVHGSRPLAQFISLQAPWNLFVAMLVLYLITSLAIWVLFRMVARFIDRVKLKEFDRQLGALFGLAKGVLWCVVITFFAVTLSASMRPWVLGTKSGYYTALLLHRATPLLPEEVRQPLGKYIEDFDRRLDPDQQPEPAPEETVAQLGAGVSGKRLVAGRLLPRLQSRAGYRRPGESSIPRERRGL